MASNQYIQRTASGESYTAKRATKQGRRPSGLAAPQLVRLYKHDKIMLAKIAGTYGEYWNENEFIRMAVHNQIKMSNSVYTELLIP